MSEWALDYPEGQPEARRCFDGRFVTPNFKPKIIVHDGERKLIHEIGSLPLLIEGFLFYDAGMRPKGHMGENYYQSIEQDDILRKSLYALKQERELFELACSAVVRRNDASEVMGGEVRLHMNTDNKSEDNPPCEQELIDGERAQLEYDYSVIYVFLAETAQQLDPSYDIENIRR